MQEVMVLSYTSNLEVLLIFYAQTPFGKQFKYYFQVHIRAFNLTLHLFIGYIHSDGRYATLNLAVPVRYTVLTVL